MYILAHPTITLAVPSRQMEDDEDEGQSRPSLTAVYIGSSAVAFVVVASLTAVLILLAAIKWSRKPKGMIISHPQSYHGRFVQGLPLDVTSFAHYEMWE